MRIFTFVSSKPKVMIYNSAKVKAKKKANKAVKAWFASFLGSLMKTIAEREI